MRKSRVQKQKQKQKQQQKQKHSSTQKRKRQWGGSSHGLSVHFHTSGVNAVANTNVNRKEVNLDDVKEQPTITWSSQSGKVTIICWDPDAPTPTNPKGFIHLLACNQTGTILTNPSLSWVPPSPPHGALHHYWFGLFQQTDGVPVEVPTERSPFILDDFVTKNKLTLLEKVGFVTQNKSWFA